MGLLGSILIDGRVLDDIYTLVPRAEDFYKPAHVAIYRVMLELHAQQETVGALQAKQRLEDKGLLQETGGVDYLVQLAEQTYTSSGAGDYARIVREKAILRKLIDAAGSVLHRAYTSADPVKDQLDLAEKVVFDVAGARDLGEEATDLKTLLHETYDRLSKQVGKRITGLSTGLVDLDEQTCGLQPGEMIILAARPSMGKTALALNIAEHIGATQKEPVLVFSLEMSKHQLASRLLCSRSGVNSQALRKNDLGEQQFQALSLCVGELSDAPIFIDDTPGLSLMAMRAKARRLASKHGIKAVMVDYLQLMSSPGAESRQQEVSELSRGIKALARELTVPIVCLSQLNRAAEAREGHRPRMSDLRESGSIEQDADVLMLHREEYYHQNDPDWVIQNPNKAGVAELIISKQRNGPTGTVYLTFDSATTTFRTSLRPHPQDD